jgi:hypothetical protein
MFKFRLLQLPLLLLALISHGRAQFAHIDHKQIVDAAGKPFFLRATNLGNWLVPEGYMWLFDVPIWMGESGENTDEWIARFAKALGKKQYRMGFLAV